MMWSANEDRTDDRCALGGRRRDGRRHPRRRAFHALTIMPCLVIVLALLPSLAWAQALPQPRPHGAGSCPHGYAASGSFCVPRQGAQEAIPLPPAGSCPWSWTRSGSFCLRSQS